MRKILTAPVIILLLLIYSNGSGQDADQYLKNFLAVQIEDHVYLRWTISAGNTCDGTIIERSTEGGRYQKIGEIPGVCGSPDVDITYDLTDTNPLPNRVNSYRILLGLLGYSSPIPVEFILLNDDGYTVQPNPVRDRSEFIFENPEGLLHEFCLIDASGKLVMSINTSNDRIFIDRNLLSSGTYVFKLRYDQRLKAVGKVVVM